MHILFLLTQDLESPYGLGRCWPVARYLARRGHTVEIAALHPAWHGLARRTYAEDGVRVHYVAQMHNKRAGSRRTYFSAPQLLWVTAWAAIALAYAAWRSPAHVLVIGKAQPMNGLAGWLVSKLQRRRLFLDYDDYEAASNHFASEWQRQIVAWWEDRLPRVVQGVTVNTTFLRERCLRLGVPAAKIRLVSNGFDPERFLPVSAEQIAAVRRQWGVIDQPVVLYLGSMSLSNHPVLMLIEAFAILLQRLPQACLCLVGGGEDYDRIAGAVEARGLAASVRMTGAVAADQVAPVYAASQVVVDPVDDDDIARSRGPLKLVEALACGVPVVTGNIGDRASVLGGQVGRLVAPGSATALADGLFSILTETGDRARQYHQALAASQPYRWDRLVCDFEALYAE